MANRVIFEDDDFPIAPRHINAEQHFWEAFGNNETEVSAHYVVVLMQELGGWKPFTQKQIDEVYARAGYCQGFEWSGLRGQSVPSNPKRWWPKSGVEVPNDVFIAQGDDERFYITDAFITRCYQASPVKPSKKTRAATK